MNYLPLFLVYNPPYETMSDKLKLCGKMLLQGMGTVFLVLIVLWGIIELFSYISTSGERAAKKQEETKAAAPAPAAKNEKVVKSEEIAEPIVEAAPVADNDDGAIVAAIMAAIEAYRREEGTYSLPYRVVSFKRKNTKNSRG